MDGMMAAPPLSLSGREGLDGEANRGERRPCAAGDALRFGNRPLFPLPQRGRDAVSGLQCRP